MHELAIAESIVKIALGEIEKRKLYSVNTIHVRIGALNAVVPEALQFGFEAITADTRLADTRLDIESVSIKGKCRKCSSEFEVEEFMFICPLCGSAEIKLIQGEELHVAYMEVEDEKRDTV